MNIKEKVLDVIFPPVCGLCNRINKDFLCDLCKNKIDEIKISSIEDYSDLPVYFDEHYYTLKYAGEVRDYILKYKFNEKSYLYKSFAKIIMDDSLFTNKFINKYDCIICVPIHKKRFNVRGYNQSGLIAEEIAKKCQLEYYNEILVKSKNKVAQSTLDKLERVSNVKGAFAKGKNIHLIEGKNVALFDDIYTTGATVNECARILKDAGASFVGVFTLAKD